MVFFASFALAKTAWARTREEVVDAKKGKDVRANRAL
jgi:hypothetical protein